MSEPPGGSSGPRPDKNPLSLPSRDLAGRGGPLCGDQPAEAWEKLAQVGHTLMHPGKLLGHIRATQVTIATVKGPLVAESTLRSFLKLGAFLGLRAVDGFGTGPVPPTKTIGLYGIELPSGMTIADTRPGPRQPGDKDCQVRKMMNGELSRGYSYRAIGPVLSPKT